MPTCVHIVVLKSTFGRTQPKIFTLIFLWIIYPFAFSACNLGQVTLLSSPGGGLHSLKPIGVAHFPVHSE